MSRVRIKLKYPELAVMLQDEINKRKVEIKGHPITVDQLSISKELNQVKLSADIQSKWNASFLLNMTPEFLIDETRLELNDLSIDFNASNILFRGILNVAKGNIIKRIEKIAEEPLVQQLKLVQTLIDNELSKVKLPHRLKLNSSTKALNIQKLEFNKDHLFLDVDVEQILQIEFSESEIKQEIA